MDVAPDDAMVKIAHARTVIDQVEAAIARIEQGTYGKCESCGQDIDEAMLDVDPLAQGCMCHQAAGQA